MITDMTSTGGFELDFGRLTPVSVVSVITTLSRTSLPAVRAPDLYPSSLRGGCLAMQWFVRSGAHAAMVADMAGRRGPARFVESTAVRAGLPLDWAGARRRVDDSG